jgi:hypothetical protein
LFGSNFQGVEIDLVILSDFIASPGHALGQLDRIEADVSERDLLVENRRQGSKDFVH